MAIRVRFPPQEDSELVMKVLGESTQSLVASPALLERHAVPVVPAELPALPGLDLGPPHGDHVWQRSCRR